MTDIAGQHLDEYHAGSASEAEEATRALCPVVPVPPPPPPVVAQLIEWQGQRVFAITGQSICDRRCDSYVARNLGYHSYLPSAQREALFKQAAVIRKRVEKECKKRLKKGGSGQHSDAHRDADALAACRPIIEASLQSRFAHDHIRQEAEANLVRLAQTLPVWPWCAGVPGFGALGLAVLVAEAGNDLSTYPHHYHLWKRLGLAPYKGRAMSSWRTGDLAKEEWKECGYNRFRRGRISGDIGAPLFFAKACNDYGAVYAARRERTALTHPEWTLAHSDNDARRIMLKRLVADLWRAWQRASAGMITTIRLPAADPIGATEPLATNGAVPRGRRAIWAVHPASALPSAHSSQADAA